MAPKDDIISFKEKLHNVDPTIIVYGDYHNSRTKIDVGCSVCGHRWSPLPRDLLSGKGCPMCNHRSFKKTDAEFKAEAAEKNTHLRVVGTYITSKDKVEIECMYCGKHAMMTPQKILEGCKHLDCANKQSGAARRKSDEEYKQELLKCNPTITVDRYQSKRERVRAHCSVCGSDWTTFPFPLLNGTGCPECAKHNKTSFPEQALYFYIKKAYPDAINSYREVFPGSGKQRMEVDIFIPSLKTAIEYDGARWHGDDAFEHEIRKYQICKKHGIKLLRVKENQEHSGKLTSDKTIHTSKMLEDTIHEVLSYLALNVDIDLERDTLSIKEQYLPGVA